MRRSWGQIFIKEAKNPHFFSMRREAERYEFLDAPSKCVDFVYLFVIVITVVLAHLGTVELSQVRVSPLPVTVIVSVTVTTTGHHTATNIFTC